jgi:putative PEP-CTERM system TPR-repeat lipoprotein
LQPGSPGPLLRLSEAHAASRDFASALDAQRRALAVQPDSNQALVAMVATYLIAGRADEALAEARKLQKDRPKDAVGFLLESEILLAQKKPAEASVAMNQALARMPNGALAARQYAILTSAGKTAEANAFAARWAKEHPKDAAFQAQLGQLLQSGQNPDAAIAAYKAALAIEPDNAVAMNNLAWLLMERGRPDAREYAERAYLLAPLNASVVDTLGMVLIKQGDTKRGIEMLRTATRLAPANPALRLHLARALIGAGAKDEAKRELEAAVRGEASPARAEAEKLLREM